MIIQLAGANVSVRQFHPIALADAVGATLTCLRGRLWVTQEHDTRDIGLEAGESFTLDRGGRAIVSSSRGAEFRVDEPSDCRRGFHWPRRLLRPLAVAFERLRLRTPPGGAALPCEPGGELTVR